MRPARSLRVALALAAAAHGAGAQADASRWSAAVDSLMRAELAKARVPGAQIAIAQHGRLLYTKAYGVADVESGRPVTERTLFQQGSNAKVVTGAVLAQLAAEVNLDLHAPISRYVPELAGRRVGTATVHQLLTNTSGWGDAPRPFGTTDEAALGRTMVAVTDTMILLDPDQVYSYSNIGFAMAAYVAERVARAPFAELAERRVLRKVGMPRATYRPMVVMTHDFSQGHVAGTGGASVIQRPMPGNAVEYGAGFLWSSAAELARLGIALIGGGMLDGERVLAADAVRAMTTGSVRVPTGAHTWAGYGMHVDTVAGHRFWRKAGSVPGYMAEWAMWPDLELVVVVTSNRITEMPARTSFLAAQLVTGLRLEREPPAAEPPATADDQRQVLGTYRVGTDGRTFEVVEMNGQLKWRGPRNTTPIRLASANRIVIEPANGSPGTMYVLRDAGGRVCYLFSVNHVYVKQPGPRRAPGRRRGRDARGRGTASATCAGVARFAAAPRVAGATAA